tara:strand:+ start:32163 stop:33338 length:1176 start_codon:yes stop_codon:yes gene_type:complete
MLHKIPYIICPKAVIPAWREACELMGLKEAHVTNYEQIRTGKGPDYCRISNGQYQRWQWKLPQERYLIIFDEVHKCRRHSLQSRVLKHATRQKYYTLLLSATPFTTPLDLRYIGHALGIHNGNGFYGWVRQWGCYKGNWGWEFDGKPEHLERLRKYMSPRVVRTKREDIPNFPETTIQPTLYDFGAAFKKHERKYDKELQALEESRDMDNAAVRYQFYRMKVELLKIPYLVDHVKELNLDGFKVVVFFSFLRSIEEFRHYYEEPVTIVSGVQKDDLSEFRKEGEGTCVALCQYAAGGAGISLHGPDPRIAILNPTPSALEYKQALGRIHRMGGGETVQKLIFAAGTIEEKVYNSVREKAAGIDVLNDGDLTYYGEIQDCEIKERMENERTP